VTLGIAVAAFRSKATRRFFTLTNDGESSYRGISLEWVKTIGKHTFAINGN